jgi:hypothetical protein
MQLKLAGGTVVTYDDAHDLFAVPVGDPDRAGGGPLSVCLRINNRCHFQCHKCRSASAAGGCRDEEVQPILQTLSALAPMRILWCGGETTLSPRLGEYVAWSHGKGLLNVVTTNMAAGDPLSGLAGSFFYQVGIHGTDAHAFKNSTGWNLFDAFARHFEHLFELGHAVTAALTIQADWQDNLERCLNWLKAYPLRRLLISNTADAGSNLFGGYTVQAADIEQMRSTVQALAPQFPVVFPWSPGSQTEGVIVIDAVPDGSAFAKINGATVSGREMFLGVLNQLGPANVRHYTGQRIYLPQTGERR